MLHRRKFVLAGSMALAASLGMAGQADAEAVFKRLLPMFVDLPGWVGEKAYGMTMETCASGAFTTAARKYSRGPASLEASVLAGPVALGAVAQITSGVKFETSAGHVLPVDIAGRPSRPPTPARSPARSSRNWPTMSLSC